MKRTCLAGAAGLLLSLSARAQNAMPSFFYDNLKKECDGHGGGACCRGAVDEMKAAQAMPATENGLCLDDHSVVKPPCSWAIAWCKPGGKAAKATADRQDEMRRGALSPWVSGGSFRATVLKVTAPDRLLVLQNKTHRHRIVLRGVQAPKRGTKHYQAALLRARKLVEGREVLVENFHNEVTGAHCASVLFDDAVFLSDALAAEGLVRWDLTADPVNRGLSEAEAAAKKAQKGVWARR